MASGELAESFGVDTGRYERGRPDYPEASVRWLVQRVPPGGHVVDVGAGTGKLARVVHGLGYRVTAVDPDPAMLGRLRAVTPSITTTAGRGQQLPLDDGVADAILYGQAWHWVDPDRASAEAARVLRPGGTLGLIWNIRDTDQPWVAAMSAIMHGSAAELLIDGDGPVIGRPFGAADAARWPWERPMRRDDLVDMVQSRSYVITATPARRAEILAGIDRVLDEVFVDTDTVGHPYITHAFRAVASATRGGLGA